MEDMRKRGIEYVGASSNATANNNNKIHEAEADQFSSDQIMFHPDKDPKKLKELIANRGYSQKFRLKKAHYLAELEEQAISLEGNVSDLRSQVEAYKNEIFSLQVEQQSMKLDYVRQEKERIIQEGEIEKNKEEVKKQWEVLSKQLEALRDMTMLLLNSHANMETTSSSSNAIPSSIGLGPMASTNSVQDSNDDGVLNEKMKDDHEHTNKEGL